MAKQAGPAPGSEEGSHVWFMKVCAHQRAFPFLDRVIGSGLERRYFWRRFRELRSR